MMSPMNRSLLVVAALALAGCPHPTEPAADPAPTPTAPVVDAAAPVSPVASATTTVHLLPPPPPASADAAAHVQAILPHWIELLEHGDDAAFIDEAVVPEELTKVLAGKSKSELVVTFRDDKHKGVLKALGEIRGAQPTTLREEGDRTFVTYELRRDKGITFVVVGTHVYVKN
jgi:hypothetical protein